MIADCFTSVILLLSRDCLCSVSLPCCVMGCSVIVAFPSHELSFLVKHGLEFGNKFLDTINSVFLYP